MSSPVRVIPFRAACARNERSTNNAKIGNAAAVRTGQVETGRVITAAATIMICVFLTFSFMGQRDVAEFGIGLAVAVALDAFILRTVLVPAAMHLFGDANWWLPGWLDRRLPRLAIEPPEATPTPPVPVPVALTDTKRSVQYLDHQQGPLR